MRQTKRVSLGNEYNTFDSTYSDTYSETSTSAFGNTSRNPSSGTAIPRSKELLEIDSRRTSIYVMTAILFDDEIKLNGLLGDENDVAYCLVLRHDSTICQQEQALDNFREMGLEDTEQNFGMGFVGITG
ncbi:hypothetical protein MBM_08058 [Drepanopeziza brunnea f. sp. 'multigermtubi' MB_m1]|uniref:Uncharacterized protein n=1 Tax=Marssonina brunnea f. sp. multigermtubi (strain MB_m1) TaxID=1072389 RepID=K1WNC9_MARBU|nr:uncharacterized protein MBM_08058 [Drepanopeziza brunnea f. sp. 'multigermtubi' MB_m1]EKD13857.1 hypothetical protein MBM_08058 [Drepanopeziza brunnea f. sp. 'multigermtubi' MB_m1]